jgi:hypothetical protein
MGWRPILIHPGFGWIHEELACHTKVHDQNAGRVEFQDDVLSPTFHRPESRALETVDEIPRRFFQKIGVVDRDFVDPPTR